ncbi:hypothetical protein [Microvirga sesbaniae]|uniref:hypothetical protein n=1 Tax=Microvirga sesbaniae TaxID=681392 RepID=UPI0021C75C9A|nr:hypothetical protein [Microvirga sp. HBU67692]
MWNCVASASILALITGLLSVLIPLSVLHVHSRRQGAALALVGFIGCGLASDANPPSDVLDPVLSGRVFDGDSLMAAPHQELASQPQSSEEGLSVPADQQKFLGICHKARVKYSPGGREDMVNEFARFDREKLLCDAFPSPDVQNWIGQIAAVSTDTAGRLALAVSLDANTTLSAEPNGFVKVTNASNLGAPGALLEISPLTKEQWVRFSGSFIKAKRDCFSEKSMTLSGSMQKPEFAFQFSDISLIP